MFNDYESLDVAIAVKSLCPEGVEVHAWKDKVTGAVTYETTEEVGEFTEAQVLQALVDSKVAEGWEEVRVKRNNLLARCDWTQLPNTPLTAEQVTAWDVYRQALRDVTAQVDPFNIEWPVAP
jgi:hypothetical protein